MKRNSKAGDLNGMIKDTGILLLITVIAGLVLGFVYNLTKEPIAKQQELKIQKACAEVYETAEKFEELSIAPSQKAWNAMSDAGYEGIGLGPTYAARDSAGMVLGYVITVTSNEGYGGDITLLMGVGMDGTVMGVSMLEISETAGLGMKAQPFLAPQFANKDAKEFEYTKTGKTAENQIDAISGATITTKAVTDGVNAGLIFFREDLSKGGKEG